MNKKQTQEYIRKIQRAAEAGRIDALKRHKAFGILIVTEKNGEVVEMDAGEKLIDCQEAVSPGFAL